MIIYCCGIGGIGLSAYASLRKHAGDVVRGSDRADSALLQDLRDSGIEVFLDQDGSRVTDDIELFVYSEAVPPDAPERVKATELGIPQQNYFEALGEMSKDYDVIAVCGTHGKSSTTAMAAKVFVDAGLDPTVVVGTKSPDLGGKNWRKGSSNVFIVEACEYRRDFRFLSPDTILCTNVDGDHFDAFGSIGDYHAAFEDFFRLLPENGSVVLHGGDEASVAIARKAGKTSVDADALPLPELTIPGAHMRDNARLVLALARQRNLPDDVVLRSLKEFRGTWRRMDVRGTRSDGVTVIDDYAHHPVEIKATLQGIREGYPGRRIVVVFQPHTHDRTLKLYDEFLTAFSGVDLLGITNVYDARKESDSGKVDFARFVREVAAGSAVRTVDAGDLSNAFSWLREALQPNDVVITMGAGDVTSLAQKILDQR